MVQQNLNDFSIAAIEHEILVHANIVQLAADFPYMKVGKIPLM